MSNSPGVKREVRQDASPDFSGRVYIISGDDDFRKSITLKRLKAKLIGKEADSLHYEYYYGKDCDIRELIDSLNTPSMDGSKKMLYLDKPEHLPQGDAETLKNHLKSSHNLANYLVIVTDTSKEASLTKDAASFAKITYINKLGPQDMPAWVDSEFRSRKKTASRSGLQILCEASSWDSGRAFSMVEQISLYAGDSEKISDEDIRLFAGGPQQASTYDLLDAVNSGNAAASLNILSNLFVTGLSPQQIMGSLGWHAAKAVAVKKMLLKRMPAQAIVSEVGVSQYRLASFISQVEKASLSRLKERMKFLLDTDLMIKRSAVKAQSLLEILVVRLCAQKG